MIAPIFISRKSFFMTSSSSSVGFLGFRNSSIVFFQKFSSSADAGCTGFWKMSKVHWIDFSSLAAAPSGFLKLLLGFLASLVPQLIKIIRISSKINSLPPTWHHPCWKGSRAAKSWTWKEEWMGSSPRTKSRGSVWRWNLKSRKFSFLNSYLGWRIVMTR